MTRPVFVFFFIGNTCRVLRFDFLENGKRLKNHVIEVKQGEHGGFLSGAMLHEHQIRVNQLSSNTGQQWSTSV